MSSWVALDWGTTNFRAYLMDNDDIVDQISSICDSETGMIVNNNAAAVLLSINGLAHGGEVIVSRGELVEIGGSFRIPDIIKASGATLKEVGTTNRTHFQDYKDAINQNTKLILTVHTSNYVIKGFTKSVDLTELVYLGNKNNIHNENFDLADKWILFSETYNSDANDHKEKLQSIKLLYDLKTSNDDNQFINILLDSDIFKGLSTDNIKEDVLLTILAVINFDLYSQINETKSILDERPMPSRYLLNKIKNTAETNNYGELALSINISMKNKKWDEIHPEHLRIILVSLKNSQIENVFKNIILEILEESKII